MLEGRFEDAGERAEKRRWTGNKNPSKFFNSKGLIWWRGVQLLKLEVILPEVKILAAAA